MPSPRHRRLFALLALSVAIAAVGAKIGLSEDAEELFQRSRDAYEAGDTRLAVELADQAVAAEPKNPRCYTLRATLHELMRDFTKVIEDCDKLIELEPGNPAAYQRRGAAHFRAGHIEESIRDFDKFIELRPREEPYHWQRGLAYYYAGRFEDGRKQFELHQTVNRNDVENAVWHYACVAREDGAEAAREKLIPITGDSRVPMAQVHALFAGKGTPESVLAAARAGEPNEAELENRLFYAHLYLGLYYEVAGETARAREHIELAAGKHAQTHYMGDVARVHAARLRDAETAKPKPPKPPSDLGDRP